MMANDRTFNGKESIGIIALLALLMMSALAVICCKDYSRSIFIEIESIERALDQYEVEWGQMRLELSTYANQNRVAAIAREQIKLVMPTRESIVYIKP
jgi:cell division protein FtsL